MAKICFEIEVDTETGEVMAGVCPPDDMAEMEEDKTYLQPVATLGEAIGMAHDALMNTQGPAMTGKAKRDEIRSGYDRVKGNGPSMMGGD